MSHSSAAHRIGCKGSVAHNDHGERTDKATRRQAKVWVSECHVQKGGQPIRVTTEMVVMTTYGLSMTNPRTAMGQGWASNLLDGRGASPTDSCRKHRA